MTVDRKTSAQFAADLRTALLNKTSTYDTAYGPVKDVVINPVSVVLEDQNNNRLRKVSLLLSLLNEDEFSEDDLNALVFNEGITRPQGSQATTTLTFRRFTAFASAETGALPRGFPIGTSLDEASGQAVTFVTTESKDKTEAVAVLDPDTNQTVYELAVPSTCIITGSAGQVGPNRINRPLRPLVGYDEVTNKESTNLGHDRYTNRELVELYLLAVASRQLSVPGGSEFHVRDNFTAVEDVNEVYGTDPLLERAGDDAGAVDSYIIGEDLHTTTDQITFLGIGQKLQIVNPPVVSIDSVVRASDSTTFTEGDDYEVALDDSGVSGSTRAADGIVFLPTVSPTVVAGDLISVTYTYNQLIRDLQADTEDREVNVQGRDMLFRLAEKVDIFLSATLIVTTGFSAGTIQTLVEATVIDFINSLELGDDVEISDIQQVVRQISGVDNFIITRLSITATDTSAADVVLDGNQYPDLNSTNLSVVIG